MLIISLLMLAFHYVTAQDVARPSSTVHKAGYARQEVALRDFTIVKNVTTSRTLLELVSCRLNVAYSAMSFLIHVRYRCSGAFHLYASIANTSSGRETELRFVRGKSKSENEFLHTQHLAGLLLLRGRGSLQLRICA